MKQVLQTAMASPYDLLLGRNTYNLFAPNFSNVNDSNPVAARLNAATKYVVTSDPTGLNWPTSVAITDDVVNEIRKLKSGDGPLLQVHGSWQLIQLLLRHELIDEFRLWTFPVVVGAGKRPFETSTDVPNLKLSRLEACSSGAFMNIFGVSRS